MTYDCSDIYQCVSFEGFDGMYFVFDNPKSTNFIWCHLKALSMLQKKSYYPHQIFFLMFVIQLQQYNGSYFSVM